MEKLLIVNTGENLEDKLFRVKRGTVLTLKPGPRCLALEVTIQTNYPVKKDAKFDRGQYHILPISADHQDLISSSLNWHVSLPLKLAGTFHFLCSADGEPVWQAYVIVDPEIKVPLDSIKCQTVLTKSLGPFKEWRQRLSLSKDAKYNMIHFTPIQELGASNSSYSLRNQLKLNPKFQATLDDVKKEVEFMEKRWNVLSVTDIVLNHTANDSPWIHEHPECAYNLDNSPHLRPAFLLDSAFIWLMKDMISRSLERTVSLSTVVESEQDVQTISILLKTFYVPILRIYELYMIDVGSQVARYDELNELRADQLEVDYGMFLRNKATVKRIPHHIQSRRELENLIRGENLRKMNQIKGYLNYAIDNAMSAIRYERLNPSGPYFRKPVDPGHPLVAPYFNHSLIDEFSVATEEKMMYESGARFMANNGWVMGSSSTEDFAGPNSLTYLKRELIAWGDCIKLNYSFGPDRVPYLWEHMRKYVEAQAKIFHGFRLDNCHSTPIHVAEFVVDVARSIRPDIYIMAELFTSSESTDNIFVNKLGITSLIRESMSAHDSRELGRLVYRFGGMPVGAFYTPVGSAEPLKPGVAHAIFYDQTHDNDSPISRRSAYDVPATTALINMANCATGSNRGYDELVPHHINVVTEDRLYPLEVDEDVGILPLRKVINGPLSRELNQGFSEIFVDQRNDDVLAVTRHNPVDGRSIVLIARTAFSKEPSSSSIPTLPIQGRVSKVIFEFQAYGDPDKYERNPKFINGLSSFKMKLFSANCRAEESKLAQIVNLPDQDRAEILFNEFQFLPSSVMAIEISLSDRQAQALKIINSWEPQINDITFNDANYILFRCAQEDGVEPYALFDYCKFTYAGLYGLMYHLEQVRENQDQAHPLAMNLRQGNWLSEYIVSRLRMRPKLSNLAEHLDGVLKQVDLLPRGMVPKYFDLIVTKLYNSILELIYSRMSVFVHKGPHLVKLLALSSVALVGKCSSAPLPKVEANKLDYLPSIAAGLPHFASGYMRNWGRDTFIAMRGLLLVTGRFAEAKVIILAYAASLNHGLIPNLLDAGINSRYNCRDAVWWWLYSIKEYVRLAPNGNEILRSKVKRIHRPIGQANSCANIHSQALYDVMQEALQAHFEGLEFIEDNAGHKLDEHMRDEGFKVSIGVKRETGFVYGGNRWNCGTWMDKMGSSVKAKNKGVPASPRDGSAVEIVGLSKAVVTWLDESFKCGIYPHDGVECLYDNTITLKWTWKRWATMIQSNFERYFYVPREDESPLMEDPQPELINKRGIYKDTIGASIAWQDYQLRPNFLVAMVVAPELFDKRRAIQALEVVKEHLCGPLGMKTLDPSDWNYCGDYDNGNDSDDPKVAHGFNYHQGPEWLWLTGYYIRASSRFVGLAERSHHLQLLANFYATLVETPWLGLPELTNIKGSICRDSCRIQAWSLGAALEALYESVRAK